MTYLKTTLWRWLCRGRIMEMNFAKNIITVGTAVWSHFSFCWQWNFDHEFGEQFRSKYQTRKASIVVTACFKFQVESTRDHFRVLQFTLSAWVWAKGSGSLFSSMPPSKQLRISSHRPMLKSRKPCPHSMPKAQKKVDHQSAFIARWGCVICEAHLIWYTDILASTGLRAQMVDCLGLQTPSG